MTTYYSYDTILGKMIIAENGTAITHIFRIAHQLPSEAKNKETPLIQEAHKQLTEYFELKRTSFTLPLAPEGTEFQKRVWNELINIPYGQTKTYGEIAAAIGNPKASRAVGMSNHNNPIMIVIPCHRVIGKNGQLTGYAGGIDIKEKLLNLESKNLHS